MSAQPLTGEVGLAALLSRLRRYKVGFVYAPPRGTLAVLEAMRRQVPGLYTVDLLASTSAESLRRLLARNVVTWSEAVDVEGPAIVTGSEALWTTLAPVKQEDAWRALVLSERPPAPRLVMLQSPFFLDRLGHAVAGSPQPDRLVHWHTHQPWP